MNYTIYQLRDMRSTEYGFMGWSFAQQHEFNLNDYDPIYSGNLAVDNNSDSRALEYLWEKFNLDHPEDFIGHSLSVSDVVKLTDANNVNRYYYCDSIGWRDVTNAVLSAA